MSGIHENDFCENGLFDDIELATNDCIRLFFGKTQKKGTKKKITGGSIVQVPEATHSVNPVAKLLEGHKTGEKRGEKKKYIIQ